MINEILTLAAIITAITTIITITIMAWNQETIEILVTRTITLTETDKGIWTDHLIETMVDLTIDQIVA